MESLTPKEKAVHWYFMDHSTEEFSIRDIERRFGYARKTTAKVLKSLNQMGLLETKKEGVKRLYWMRLNK